MTSKKKETSSLPSSMRQAFAAVAGKSEHVQINYGALKAYAEALPTPKDPEAYDTLHHFAGSPEDTAAYIMALDSINFGGPSKKDLMAEGAQLIDHSLYFTVATRLKEYFEQNSALSALQLSALTAKDCISILGLPASSKTAQWLCNVYAKSLNELGDYITNTHDGKFLDAVTAAKGSVENFVSALAALDTFNDVFAYKGMQVPIYKRAQIMAADIHLAFKHIGEDGFDDIDQLTMFPDNAVAHVLHEDGILIYSDDLEEAVASGSELEAGCEEEIEIRANTAHAVELIKQYRPELSAMNIDHILWHKSHEAEYRKRPHHKVRTIFY